MVMIEWFDGSRSQLADLFALADDSPTEVERYRDLGRVLVARDGPSVIGHLQLIAGARADEAEVRSLAVREHRPRTGIARRLIERAVAVCREENRSVLRVATAAADTPVLRFYQRLGFRFVGVERDVFTPEAGYPPIDVDGVPLRDQVWLSLSLQKPDRSGARAHPCSCASPVIRSAWTRSFGSTETGSAWWRSEASETTTATTGGPRGPGTGAHLELTTGGGHGAPVPHPESLLVLYLGQEEAVQTGAARLGSTRSPRPTPTGLSSEPPSPTRMDSTSFSCPSAGNPRKPAFAWRCVPQHHRRDLDVDEVATTHGRRTAQGGRRAPNNDGLTVVGFGWPIE